MSYLEVNSDIESRRGIWQSMHGVTRYGSSANSSVSIPSMYCGGKERVLRHENIKSELDGIYQKIHDYVRICEEKDIIIEDLKNILDVVSSKLKYEDTEEMLKEYDLLCPVCMEGTSNKTSCNHALCLKCFNKIEKCPLCRASC